MVIVVKFGGSSLADANQFKKVADIIRADPKRRFVIPSAPGKRFSDDDKITDMLYKCYDDIQSGKKRDESSAFSVIEIRFQEILDGLGLPEDLLREEYKAIVKNFQAGFGRDYAASRGEYLNGIILAHYLGFEFVDAAKVIKFDTGGRLDTALTDDFLHHALTGFKKTGAVIPGFYGAMPDDTVKTFSRGGSDITGALAAKAVGAELYENWTDVPGFLVADPRVVSNPEVISTITYQELRELSYMGATVLHEETIFPVCEANIPINVKNTNDPAAPGTWIVSEAPDERSPAKTITGIAGKKNYSVIHIEKNRMNDEIGFLRRILAFFEFENINFEHVPTGIDTLSIVLESSEFDKHPDIIERIAKITQADVVEAFHGLALIAVVGRGMRRKRGTAARIFAALSRSDINIRIIDQGSSELNIIIGVNESDFEQAIRVIYNMFMLPEQDE